MRQGEAHIRRPLRRLVGILRLDKSIRLPDKYIRHTRHLLVEVRQDDSPSQRQYIAHPHSRTKVDDPTRQDYTLAHNRHQREMGRHMTRCNYSCLRWVRRSHRRCRRAVDTLDAYIAIVHCRTHIHYSRHREVSRHHPNIIVPARIAHRCTCTRVHFHALQLGMLDGRPAHSGLVHRIAIRSYKSRGVVHRHGRLDIH